MGKYMKALVFATVNLADGSVLHLDPNHPLDQRARYPEVPDPADQDRLEREGMAEKTNLKERPEFDIEAAIAEEEQRTADAEQARREGKPLPADPRTVARPFNLTRAAIEQQRREQEVLGRRPGMSESGLDATRDERPGALSVLSGTGSRGPTAESDEEAEAAAGDVDATAAPARGGRGGGRGSRSSAATEE